MLRCIKIECTQPVANYKKPMAIAIEESYKLPPYSTVIGMIHNICGFTEYHPMQVSIQGNYDSVISDLYTRYFFGISYDPTRHQLFVENAKGGKDGITRGLGYAEALIDVNLILHIMPTEEDFDIVYQSLLNPLIYPALGRYNDLLRIDSISIVELEEADTIRTNHYSAYIPEEILEKRKFSSSIIGKGCTVYYLNKNYVVEDGIRKWKKVKVYHFSCYEEIDLTAKAALKEKESNLSVFFA